MMKPTRTWILIADGARARVLLNEGPGKGITAVDGMNFTGSHAATRDIMADKPGRSFESVGDTRHALQNPSDPHQLLKQQFVDRIAAIMTEHQSAYDSLIIVSPPATLGMIRKALSKAVANKVKSELGKDLTHTTNTEIAAHLEGVLAI
ncbi:MAG: host attachment protein [Hyphomicrobiaceae bacterium]